MDNKLSELSKPVGFIEQSGMAYLRSGEDADIWPDGGRGDDIPLYSQEYVSALLARIAELEAKLTLSSDVRKHYLAGYDDGHSRGLNAGRLYKADDGMIMHRHASANAYAVEGDE